MSLERTTPESQSIHSQSILDFIDAVESNLQHMHSFMLLRHGKVVAEGAWAPYALGNPHMLYSLSKSFTSTAVGLAVAEGRLSLDDPLIAFFPAELPAEVSPNLAAMRVRHLLSMSTGHAEDTSGKMSADPDHNWERAFLAAPVEFAPGTHFVYNNGATYMLSSILYRLTGETLLSYLTPRLFEPLGIENPSWETSPGGANVGYKGLMLKIEDIARFGQLYLDQGVWRGQRILPEAWVTLATSKQVENRGDGSGPVDWSQGYGFQFWRCQHNAYRGDGAFGQYCIVMPEQDAVLAINSGLDVMQEVMDLIWQHLLPGMVAEPLPASSASERLAAKLACLEIPARPQTAGEPIDPAWMEQISGRAYRLEPNYLGIDRLRLTQSPGCIRLERGEQSQEYGLDAWRPGLSHPYLPWLMEMQQSTGMDPAALQATRHPVAASATWTGPDELTLTARYLQTPFVSIIVLRFSGDQVTLDESAHVSFGPMQAPQIKGTLEAA